jgi:hypothetical protein
LGSSAGLPQFFTENQFQYVDSLAVTKGKHSLKFGGEYRRIRNGSSFFNDAFSSIFPWGVDDTVTDLNLTGTTENLLFGGPYYGAAYLASASLVPSTGAQPDFYRGFRANEVAFYAQDDWRVSNRLTVNVGLRWEYFGPPHNFQTNIDSNFYFGSTVTPIPTATSNPFFPVNSPFYAGVATGNFQVRNASIWNKDTNNFSPRIGFAYDVLGNQKVVLRAGFGVMYDRVYNNIYENIRFNPPYFSDNQIGIFANGVPAPASLLAFPFTDAARAQFNNPAFSPLPNPRHMDQNSVTPYYEQAHVGVQWEFAKGYVFEPEYVGTFGHKLSGITDINTFDGRIALGGACSAPDDPGCRINPAVAADNFRGNRFASNYHSLQMSLRKNYSSGLVYDVNYTYSKALDDLSDAFNARNNLRPTDNMNVNVDYGPADFDVRHRIVGNVSYELPFMKSNRWLGGWGVNSIASWQTGHPFSPYDSSSTYDLNKDGYRSDRIIPIGSPSSTILSGSASDSCTAAGAPGKCYFDTTKWVDATCPASVNGGLWCNPPIGRNALFGPSAVIVNLGATKKFKITEGSSLTFMANFFNIFNHPNFLTPSTGANAHDGTYGTLTSTWGDNGGHRITQLALRFDF